MIKFEYPLAGVMCGVQVEINKKNIVMQAVKRFKNGSFA